jgi:hypothetical protein
VTNETGGKRDGDGGARLPCDPGTSRFHIKGLSYRGIKQFIHSRLPGGHDAIVRSLDDARLPPFLEQRFLASSRYDILPMLPINAAIARQLGVPLRELAAQQGDAQARYDAGEVYRRTFEVMTLEDPVGSMNRYEMLYYDFGECRGAVVAPGHVVQVRRGMPEYLLPWFTPMHTAYIKALFVMKGAPGVEVVPQAPIASGVRHGLRIVDVETHIRW